MKAGIHPKQNNIKFVCSCGEEFVAASTREGETYQVEVCSKCHPYYTGTQGRTSHTGRVDKFNKKYGFDKKEA